MSCALPEADLILYPFRRLEEIIKRMAKSATGLDMCFNAINLRKENPDFQRKDLLQLMLVTKISNEEFSALSYERLPVMD